MLDKLWKPVIPACPPQGMNTGQAARYKESGCDL
jgi:hypothetical protein